MKIIDINKEEGSFSMSFCDCVLLLPQSDVITTSLEMILCEELEALKVENVTFTSRLVGGENQFCSVRLCICVPTAKDRVCVCTWTERVMRGKGQC